MTKKMLIDATHPEETRVVVVDGAKVEEFDFETLNKRQLQGNIYLAKVTRVEPSLQAAFVDYGGNRHGFLAFAEIHPDYYQIPREDRSALIEEEKALSRTEAEDDRPKADAPVQGMISAMDVVDLGDAVGVDALFVRPAAPEMTSEPVAEPAAQATADDDNDVEVIATEDDIESVAEEDIAEEIRAPRLPRGRRYKIQEVIKVRQIMLVQVVKEERGNKGAALTTYLSLAGRYCVLMPNTARGGGISRKITNIVDRKKLKEMAAEMTVPEGAGLIIRTAGAKQTKPEIRRDYEYLMRMWEQVRELALRSVAPAAIYEEGDLIKRSIRDLYNREIGDILVEGEAGYRAARDFMQMIMPMNVQAVKRYHDQVPLFAAYQVENYLAGMFNPVVQLRSGGYIVIGVTEALVAIDVNSGRATKEGSIEETALRTNLEAADEVARQLRLRDLAGLVVIDFIDMEERRNNASVEKRLKEALRADRARIQMGRISGFGLMEMSRQRLRPGMIESTTQPCPHCHGTGLIRSDDSLSLTILRALEQEGAANRSKEVLLRAPVVVINYLINQKREHIAKIETRYAMAVRLEADPALVSPDYSIEKFKTATRMVPETTALSADATLMGALLSEPEPEPADPEPAIDALPAEEQPETAEGDDRQNGGKKKRRRRSRKRNGKGADGSAVGDAAPDQMADDAPQQAEPEEAVSSQALPVAEISPEPLAKDDASAPKKRTVTRKKTTAKPAADKPAEEAVNDASVTAEVPPVEPVPEETPKKTRKTAAPKAAAKKTAAKTSRKKAEAEGGAAALSEGGGVLPDEAPKKPAPRKRASKAKVTEETPVLSPDAPVAEPPAEDDKPKRRGWWSVGK